MRKFFLFFTLTFLTSLQSLAGTNLEVELRIKDHKFEPEEIKVPSGEKIKITIYNEDSTIEEFESTDLNREKVIPANGKATIVLAPMKPGVYQFFGDFNQETAQGKIIVE